jgi:hypothetical protein
VLVLVWTARAQNAPLQPAPAQAAPAQAAPSPPAPSPPAASPAFRSDFIDALGHWFSNSKASIDSQLKDTQDTLGGIGTQATDAVKDAAGAAKQATGIIVDLPKTRIVNGRQLCPPAANGAPDCAPAVAALCRTKGFGAGRGVDINSTQKCPAWVWLSGRPPQAGECRSETFVTRAICQ